MISFEIAVFIHIYFILLFFVFALNELTNIIIELYINLKNKIRNKIKWTLKNKILYIIA